MNKQTKKANSIFGGDWTTEKLEIIEKYFKAFATIMNNQSWAKTVYIDAFAGSGEIKLTNTSIATGSPLIALQYDFSKYYFIEDDKKKLESLEKLIEAQYLQKKSKVVFINGDCNKELPKIFNELSKDNSTRGVLFLDPFALELKWNTIEQAKKTTLDIFYWFPMMANRLMFKDKNKNDAFRDKLNILFGKEDWEEKLYKESQQINMFGDVIYDKQPVEQLVKYIADRLKILFGYQPSIRLFKNSKGSPLFLLCVITTNDSEPARNLVKKLANEIFSKLDRNKIEGGIK
ncbi:MAG: three-Cys-motif partner protein TcmP [Firmicutes bacterium]|nr:three-Cys-motif partner protein TcmP [Bacillota bacterium]